MHKKKFKEFKQQNYPHIDLNEAVIMAITERLWPLCDLKLAGGCQGVAVIPPELHKEGNKHYWETEPKIKSCEECKFHKRSCERC